MADAGDVVYNDVFGDDYQYDDDEGVFEDYAPTTVDPAAMDDH